MSGDGKYRAFLLRLWRAADGQWRASLEDPHTGERRAFATLDQLLEHLSLAARSGFNTEVNQPTGADTATSE
jgi:hypothetical protein